MDRHTLKQVDQVLQRLRWQRRALTLSLSCLSLVALGALAWLATPTAASTIANSIAVACIAATVWQVWPRSLSKYEITQVVRRIEEHFPDLNQRLLTVLEQSPNPETGVFSYLQQQLVDEVKGHSYKHPWSDSVSNRRVWGSGLLAVCSILLVLFTFDQLHSQTTEPDTLADQQADEAGDEPQPKPGDSKLAYKLTVEPGNIEVERGTALLILARFEGPLPSSVSLVSHGDDDPNDLSQTPAAAKMRKSLDDPLFGIRLPSVDESFAYHVDYDGNLSDQFQVDVFELPTVRRIDAKVEFPSYSNLAPEIIEDTIRVSAVEGSHVVIQCHLNKELKSAHLIATDGTKVQLTKTDEAIAVTRVEPDAAIEVAGKTQSSVLYSARVPVRQTTKYTFQLIDDRARVNRDPGEFTIHALANRPPDIKITFPARDLRVSPIEELNLEATVWDDFGLKTQGVVIALADDAPKIITLGKDAKGRELHTLSHLLQLELLNAEPDQLVSYYVFADDFAADGKTRRTMSDLFFAEVRHFEEIFREGQSPAAAQEQQKQQQKKQSPAAEMAEELAKLQKQILNATWKIIRRETREGVTEAFPTDVQLLIESQQKAVEQLKELAEKVKDAESKGHVARVAEAMHRVVESLTKSATTKASAELQIALGAERSVYQALLKLRAREHEVTQQQSSQSQSQQNSDKRNQQQLDQLELSNRDNRYQTKQQAQQQQSQQQQQKNREQLQVLNRLRDLARRQGDMNKKVRELEHAMREAKTEQEQAELERQLKRLRDEQRNLLKDVDELRNRMDAPQNQQELADSKQKLDDTRQRARQASEALKKGQLSKALNAGTRAERQLNELKEDVRKRAAGQFGDAMKDLRNQSREIGDRQDQIAKALDELKQPKKSTSLRASQDKEKLKQSLEDQQDQLDQVLDDARKVIEDAETTEPLLARQLYETVRKARADRPQDLLRETDGLFRRGLIDDANQAEDLARKGTQRLQQGIEKAADSVLGNELDSLKRAKQELAAAGDKIQQEMKKKDPKQGNLSERQQPGQQPGQKPGKQPGKQPGQKSGQNPGQKPGQQPGQKPGLRGNQKPGQQNQSQQGGNARGPGSPLTGQGFQEWSDRLRDIEELVSDPKVKADVARIREEGRKVRVEFKRHSKEPEWNLVRTNILEPLHTVEQRLQEEIMKRESPDSLVPIDRDPVPEEFSELVRRYYERIGAGK